ncbi:hypothetical protein AAC387_Pa04g2203 [Persea americana]
MAILKTIVWTGSFDNNLCNLYDVEFIGKKNDLVEQVCSVSDEFCIKTWGRGNPEPSLLQRSDWTNLTLSSIVPSATTRRVSTVFLTGNKIAELSCGVCKESYNTLINNLTEAVDVYSEWIDECERANDFEDPA